MGRLLSWCTLWAVAFGFLEAVVVVYLRELYYPDGFAFPLKPFDPGLLPVEIARETATLLMLLGVAGAATRGGMRVFAVFSWCFGVWDLVYYVALKVLIDWPSSLMEWDLLFLIPLPWTSPVLAPVLVSITLMAMGWMILREPEGRSWSFLRPRDWALEITAGLVIILSFLWNLPAVRDQRVPESYPWWLFLLGWLGGLAWFAARWRVRDAAPR